MKKAEPLISVVIPVYNVEEYLPECLNSVIGQTYKNLEIILVNDGSKDGSLNICKQYAERDQRIKIYDRTNHGASAARNFGLEHANGEFLCFVDSDDYCNTDMIERLSEAFADDRECDISICGIKWFSESEGKTMELTSAGGKFSIKEYLEKILIKWKIHLYVGAPYARMFRMSMLRENPIRFDESVSYAEDFMFNMFALNYAGYVNVTEAVLYNYRHREQGSLSYYNATKMPPGEFWRQRSLVYESFENLYKKYDLYKKYESEICEPLLDFVVGSCSYIMKSNQLKKEEKFQSVNSICNEAKARNCMNLKYKGKIVNKVRLFLLRYKKYEVLLFMENGILAIKNMRGGYPNRITAEYVYCIVFRKEAMCA